jgi:N5-(cytidine 5'-diphosphoramidyl)-L-glutamine hydrolase
MKKMKNIAITQRLTKNKNYYEIRDALDIRWADLCTNLDYIPILLPTNYDFVKYFETIKIDGIILSGGNDLGCLVNDDISRKRDVFEKKLIEFAIHENIPILGVCRGMQVIADYFNGEFKKVDGHVGVNHRIIISDESNFKEHLKKLDYVNSYHNYGIIKISKNFIASARCEDGVIEAMENNKLNIFCQMWHSERQIPFKNNELMIIKKLFG